MENAIPKVFRIFFYTAGGSLLLFGLLGIFFRFIDLIDPVGSKLADDADPLGTPNTPFETLKMLAVFASVLGAGLLFVFIGYKTKNEPNPDVSV